MPWWWINFNFKWACVYYLLATKASSQLDENYFREYYFPFYGTNAWQQWAMVKRNETHQGTWESYKWKAKEFLINSSGCQDLRLKHRQNSLFQILSHTTQHQAIDEKFNFYSSIDLSGWYNKDNSFI